MRVDAALLGAVAEVIAPLSAAALSDEDAAAYLDRMGWDLSGTGVSVSGLRQIFSAVRSVGDDVAHLLADPDPDLTDVLILVAEGAEALREVVDAIRSRQGLDAELLGLLASDLAGGLLDDYLQTRTPRLRAVLVVSGLARYEVNAASRSGPAVVRRAQPRLSVDPGRLGDLLTDPVGYFRGLYGLEGQVRRSADAIATILGPVVVDALSAVPSLTARYGDLVTAVEPDMGETLDQLLMVRWQPELADDVFSEMRAVLGLNEDAAGDLVAVLLAEANLTLSHQIGAGTLTLGLTVDARPLELSRRGVALVESGDPLVLDVELALDVGDPTGHEPVLRLGGATGPRVQIDTARIDIDVQPERPGVVLGIAEFGLRLVVARPEGDGFLSKLLPERPVEVIVPIRLRADPVHGLSIEGGTQVTVDIPLQLSEAGLQIPLLHLALAVPDAGPSLSVAVDASGSLGPFQVAVTGIGFAIDVRAGDGGALGDLDVTPRLKPPKGVGLAIDAAAVKGGGFLLFDADAGRYAGVFELTLLGAISVKAIAIVNTHNPDGSAGFALLVMITAEGFTPIPLGMGFTLTGIGGLLAINHTFDAKAITDGLRSGVLDSILFVKDPVKNISRVLSSIDKVFPVAQDRLIVGPLAEISWGTPRLVRIRLALVLELPQPVRVALLAAITVQLPDPKMPVVDLHIDAAGILDFGKQTFALDASLHDSKIAGFTLTGDMSLRLAWGENPGFLASFGGFHPKFQPPPGVRPLQRLALSLTSSDNPRVRFEAYLAVTSNTLQLGARADVHAEAAGLALDAGGSFDALLQLVPFALDVAFAAWAKVTAGGATLLAISISVDVTGPKPWHITGQASVSILFITITVGVDLTIGEAPATPPVVESVDVGAAIWAELGDPARWEAALPATATPGATLAAGGAPAPGAPLVAHPLSTVTVRQQVAPLDHRIDCIGARVPTGGSHTFTTTVGAAKGVASTVVQDQFAPAQFQKLTEDQQLTAKSFVPMNSGIALTPTQESASGPGLGWDFALQTLEVTSLDDPAKPGAVVAATEATARGPVGHSADLAQTVTVG